MRPEFGSQSSHQNARCGRHVLGSSNAGKANSGGTLGLPDLSDIISEFQATETLPSEGMDIIPEVGLHTYLPHKCTHTRTHVHNILLVRCGGTRVSPQHLGDGGLRIRKSKPETATEDPILKIS